MTSKILVTGADGFIGSHLVEHLVHKGHAVRAFVLYNSFNSFGWLDTIDEEVLSAVEIVEGDIRDSDSVDAAVAGCGTVMHLAALVSIPYSYRAPRQFVDTNVLGTLNVVTAARNAGGVGVVHASTSEVYGTAQTVPISETHPLTPQSPYAATKLAADQLALSFHRSFGTPVTVVRPFNTYGPRQSARAVIPTIITQIAAGTREVRLGATHPTRDFSFVADTAAGFAAAAGCEAAMGQTVNLGSNFEISIGDTAALIAELMETDIVIRTDETRLRPAASEVERLWADNGKAKDLMGWEPGYGGREGLRRGLTETIEWYRDPANLRRFKHERYNV